MTKADDDFGICGAKAEADAMHRKHATAENFIFGILQFEVLRVWTLKIERIYEPFRSQ